MTRDVVTVTEETNLAEVATLLETHRIKRVPVMREGKIVGIVSRSNLVRALGAALGGHSTWRERRATTTARSAARLLAELEQQPWAGKALGTGHHRQQRGCSSMVWLGRA